MSKSKIVALAEGALFQAIVYDAKSRKRAIVIYACGTDVFWANDILALFDRDRTNAAPKWLKEQLAQLPAEVVRMNWKGERVGQATLFAVPSDTAPTLHVPEGESLGEDEGAIRQSGG